MRVGMFVTATFYGRTPEVHAAVPASAVLHLHDRDWVFVPEERAQFRRVEVAGGARLANNLQEILSGIAPGQQVVPNPLDPENASEQYVIRALATVPPNSRFIFLSAAAPHSTL